MRHLQLVRLHASHDPSPISGERRGAPPFDLSRQPQRPGELCEEVRLELDPDRAREVETLAAAAGLPNPLWTTLAIEARRCLELLSAEFAVAPRVLDEAAAAGPPRGGGRLADYAAALRAATPRRPAAVMGAVVARPSVLMHCAWRAHATESGLALERWATDALAQASPSKLVKWEAAAAADARGLSEWVLLQATRARRSASTAAQTIA